MCTCIAISSVIPTGEYHAPMAFDGSAVVKLVADDLVRITGVSLDAQASGTIGLHGATGTPPDIRLPAGFQPSPYDAVVGAIPNVRPDPVELADQLEVTLNVQTDVDQAVPIKTVKTGTTTADFRITLTNTGSGGGGQAPVIGSSDGDFSVGPD